MVMNRKKLIMISLVLGLSVAPPGAFARNLNPGVVPPQSHPHGMTYGEWSAAWWQWAMSQPLAGHPFVDGPGFDVSAGQSGSVWFLGAPFGTVQRTVTIPVGKSLFVGLLNAEASDLEGLGS